MSYKIFMNKIRYWDNLTAKWILRHFYFTFFQVVLASIFLVWFINTFKVIDANLQSPKNLCIERLLTIQATNITIIVILLLLNSFWLLFTFNGIQKIINLLKDISYNTSRFKHPSNINKPSPKKNQDDRI